MKASRLETAVTQSGLIVPQQGQIAVFCPKSEQDYSVLPLARAQLVTANRVQYDHYVGTETAVTDHSTGPYTMTVVEVTRSKAQTLGLIARALSQTIPGGPVVVNGAKTDGIDSVLKQIKTILPIEHSLAKSHGKLFWIESPETLPDKAADWLQGLALAPNSAGFLTAPGMFSPDHADAGSVLLAAHFKAQLKGQAADLGAGWGWLAKEALKSEAVSGLDLYEADNTALTAATENLEPDPRVRFFWSDVTRLETDARYDTVICNPPFHQSRAAEPALGLQFIRKSAEILKPNGTLWLVANRQLPYEAALDQNFKHWKYLEENSSFKAILATKPLSASARQKHANSVFSR